MYDQTMNTHGGLMVIGNKKDGTMVFFLYNP
jgi:hypothetical protein